MWFSVVGFVLSRTVGKVFLLLLHRWAVLVRTSIFRKISHNVTFFSSSTLLKWNTVFFVYICFVFWGTSQADCGVGDMNPSVHHPGIPSLPVHTSTLWIWGDFVSVYHRDFCREHCLTWLRDCWSSKSGGAPDFSNSSKTWAKPTTWYMILYNDLVQFLRVFFRSKSKNLKLGIGSHKNQL